MNMVNMTADDRDDTPGCFEMMGQHAEHLVPKIGLFEIELSVLTKCATRLGRATVALVLSVVMLL